MWFLLMFICLKATTTFRQIIFETPALNYALGNVTKQKISYLFLMIIYETSKVTGEAVLHKRKSNGVGVKQHHI